MWCHEPHTTTSSRDRKKGVRMIKQNKLYWCCRVGNHLFIWLTISIGPSILVHRALSHVPCPEIITATRDNPNEGPAYKINIHCQNTQTMRDSTHPSWSKINVTDFIFPSFGFLNARPSFSDLPKAFWHHRLTRNVAAESPPGSAFPSMEPCKLGTDLVPWLWVSSSMAVLGWNSGGEHLETDELVTRAEVGGRKLADSPNGVTENRY